MAIRLLVIHLPSPTRSAWRSALAEAAEQAGWDVVSLDGAEPLHVREGVNTLIQDDDVGNHHPEATHVLIMAGSPHETVDTLIQVDQMDLHGALRTAAARLAEASRLAASGVSTVSSGALSHGFPGLGAVTRSSGDAVRPTGSGSALAFYETLPPRPGASAIWGADAFIWTPGSQDGLVDLTGRRRVLLYGPYLMLSAGTWTVDLVFEISIHRAICELRFEWGILHDVDTIAQRVTVSGRYEASMTHSWTDAGAVELRIWLDRSMFDGTLKVLSVTVSKVD